MLNSDAATLQYRLNLSHALYSISPTLSALHMSRSAALHPEISSVLHPAHCPKCGTYYFSGEGPSYSYLVGSSAKKKRRCATSPHSKVFRRRCRICDFSIDARTSPSSIPIHDSSKMGTVPTVSQAKQTGQEPTPHEAPRPSGKNAPAPSLSGGHSHSKPSSMKAPTLRNMLSHDHKREQAVKSQRRKKESHEGLAAFLKEL